jgi:3D (Asp-Asp-Asp) domain-containing protein
LSINPVLTNSDLGTISLIRHTTLAPDSISRLTRQEPSNPVAPVTKTGRSTQKEEVKLVTAYKNQIRQISHGTAMGVLKPKQYQINIPTVSPWEWPRIRVDTRVYPYVTQLIHPKSGNG